MHGSTDLETARKSHWVTLNMKEVTEAMVVSRENILSDIERSEPELWRYDVRGKNRKRSH